MKTIPKYLHLPLLALVLLLSGSCTSRQTPPEDTPLRITWDNSLTLPPYAGMDPHKGVAGAFAGWVGESLIIAGGANFPDAMPWDGGTKHYWSTLYRIDPRTGQSTIYDIFLEHPLAYGLSIQLPEGLLCIGGNDADCCYADLYLIIPGADGTPILEKAPWPSLPVPLSNMAGTRLGRKIYIAGGQEEMHPEASTRHFLELDLDNPDRGWQKLPAWPGADRAYSICIAQAGKIYLFGGRSFGPGREMTVHTDAFEYDPRHAEWTPLKGSYPVMAGTAIPRDSTKILLFGGVETLIPGSPNHPGFARTVRQYDTATGTLDSLTCSPWPLAVTTTIVQHGDTGYIASGEIKPGIRTPHILQIHIQNPGQKKN